jgi:elongation factor G
LEAYATTARLDLFVTLQPEYVPSQIKPDVCTNSINYPSSQKTADRDLFLRMNCPLRRWQLLTVHVKGAIRSYASRKTNVHAQQEPRISAIRNVGIIAHIDAGKTTTTERMLFHAGYIPQAGGSNPSMSQMLMRLGVDDGSTVTDYLPEERARGITITAAAITFPWAKHPINLIDTPGHVDFTFEVSRSLRVLDGAVAVLDGVAGVEAQTEKVWRQADEWDISRLVFVNKMDREGAGFGRTVREISARLSARPIVLQLPIFEGGLEGGPFKGVVDIIDSTVFTWSTQADGNSKVNVAPIKDNLPNAVLDEVHRARIAMLEALADLDDEFLEMYLEHQDNKPISSKAIRTALRTLTVRRDIVPVLCGASLRDMGVQPLLDAIVNYLPSPADRPLPVIRAENQEQLVPLPQSKNGVCALAFKIVHDPLKGPLVFVRVYQGSITKGMTLLNVRNKEKERANKLLRMYADESIELDSITEGNIGVIIGLKATVTGDTLLNKRPAPYFRLLPIAMPPPVFIASIEPDSLGEAKGVSDALHQLLREDPSLSVSIDDESGQLLLSGMGELHLEISRDKLVRQFGAKCEMGKVRVSYRETLAVDAFSMVEKVYERELNGKTTKVGVTVEVGSLENKKRAARPQRHHHQFEVFGNIIEIDLSQTHGIDGMEESEILEAVRVGVRAALQTGSTFQLPFHSVHVQVSSLLVFENQTSYQSIVSAARLASQEVLKIATTVQESVLMEPFMKVLVTVDEQDVGRVVSDMTSARGGMILSMDSGLGTSGMAIDTPESQIYAPPDLTFQHNSKVVGKTLATIVARVPLKEMVGYSRTLRSLTQGRGTFVMSLEGFERMTGERASSIRKELTGIDS